MTRSFSGTALDREELIRVLDLARRAPSAGFSQGSHFLLLTDEELDRFWDVSGAGEWFTGRQPDVLRASAVVVPLADQAAYTSRYSESDKSGHGLEDAAAWPVPYWLTDTAMATQQLLLLAEDRGWGALLFGLFRDGPTVMAHFGVPEALAPIGAVALGVRSPQDRPSGSPVHRRRRDATEVVHHQRW